MEAYAAAKAADALRRALLKQKESFAFETVFSDSVGDKLKFLREAKAAGYTIVLCFIGLEDAGLSEERVSMRVSQGGHDVPTEKLKAPPKWLKGTGSRGKSGAGCSTRAARNSAY